MKRSLSSTRVKLLLTSTALALMSLVARAESLTLTLVTPSDSATAGSVLSLDLLAFNAGDSDTQVDCAAVLPVMLLAGSRSWPLKMNAVDPLRAKVPQGGFISRRYRIIVPTDALGLGVFELALPGLSTVRTAINITPSPPGTLERVQRNASSPLQEESPQKTPAVADKAASILGRTFSGRLAAHEPTYFIYGSEKQAAKFQLSFKYKLADFGGDAAAEKTNTLQFGYTQRSLWDLDASSSPFYDTSYMPEVFWEKLTLPPSNHNGDFSWNGFQLGAKHESNGRDGIDSRSVNIAYLRTFFVVGPVNGWRLILLPKIFTHVGRLSENDNLEKYRGHGELRGVFGKKDGLWLEFSAMAGETFVHRSIQLDLSFPVRTRLVEMPVFLLFQYFNGYGESLRSYDQKSESLRAGFSLVR